MTRRTTLIISAVIIAALGAILTFSYAQNAKGAAFADSEPVKVLVATDDIPAGTSGGNLDDYTDLRDLPKASVPADALSDLTSVENLLTAVPVYEGQVIIPDQFSGSADASALTLPKGTVAMSVELEAPQRVADFVTPGSEVAIYATVKTSEFHGSDANDEGIVNNLLLPRVKVVAVGPSTLRTDDSKEDSSGEVTVAVLTVAVTNEQAKRLSLAYNAGDLHFALLGPDSGTITPGATVTGDNFFSGR